MERNLSEKSFEDLQCLWMKFGLIGYKLCDKNFDCDNCKFDEVMRNNTSQNVIIKDDSNFRNPFVDLILRINRQQFNPNYIYLKNNFILKKIFPKTYYFGLSPLAYLVLEKVFEYEILSKSKLINEDDKILKVFGKWGEVEIHSPITFHCLENLNLYQEMFNEKSWLFLIDLDESQLDDQIINENEFNTYCNAFKNKIQSLDNKFFEVGRTMQDGGKKLNYIYEIIGEKNFLSIIKKLFNQ